MARLSRLLLLTARFGLAGIANTLAGFLVIAALDLGLGVEPRIANAAGYGVGLTVSFILNRAFVFRSVRRARTTGPRFLAAAFFAFALNQIVLSVALGALGRTSGDRIAAQLLAMAAYTAAMFILCRLWVFREAAEPAIPGPVSG